MTLAKQVGEAKAAEAARVTPKVADELTSCRSGGRTRRVSGPSRSGSAGRNQGLSGNVSAGAWTGAEEGATHDGQGRNRRTVQQQRDKTIKAANRRGESRLAVSEEARADLGGNIHHGDSNTFSPILWGYLIERFSIRSMLDVGCGEGHAVDFFHRRKVFAHGIDGLPTNVARAVVPIALHDLLKGPYVMPVDLVWSAEVAEHIEPSKVNNYLDTLANGQIVAMTHAVPGQVGHHHVNCQPSSYWIDKMATRGFSLERHHEHYRLISAREFVPNYFSSTGLVFTRD